MNFKHNLTGLLMAAILILNYGCVQPEEINSSSAGNSAPEIINVFVDPLFIKVGDTAVITVIAEDPDGDKLSYEWASAIGDIIGSGASVRYSAAYCCVGTNTVTVSVSDFKGAKVSRGINIEINP
jgi:hypothetical protein